MVIKKEHTKTIYLHEFQGLCVLHNKYCNILSILQMVIKKEHTKTIYLNLFYKKPPVHYVVIHGRIYSVHIYINIQYSYKCAI